jgi:hypothetical protein
MVMQQNVLILAATWHPAQRLICPSEVFFGFPLLPSRQENIYPSSVVGASQDRLVAES